MEGNQVSAHCQHNSNHEHIASKASVASSAVYTCPMHPEIEQIGPGRCPKCGMALEPKVVDLNDSSQSNEIKEFRIRFTVSTFLTIPLFIFSMSELVPSWNLKGFFSHGGAAMWQLILATPVVLWGGWPIFVRAWESLVNRSLNMFSLIAMGVGVAYLYSIVATLSPSLFPHSFRGHDGSVALYFEAAAVITTLVLLGQFLELKARQSTSGAIRALLELTPPVAIRILNDHQEESVSIDDVRAGDLLRVKPGAKIPVDGEVVDGSSNVDESMITGESMPVTKSNGMNVVGGSLNGTGSFVMKATRIGKDTLLAQIVHLVAEAQRSRAPIQRLADKVAGYFVPAVVGIAIITFAVWGIFGPEPKLAYALLNSIAVLIIACPCALGLATPVSIMVGTGKGALLGVLIRDAAVLEKLEAVNTLVVDKTGTLTEGKPKLVAIETIPPFTEDEILQLSASLEAVSEHPLALAIMNEAKRRSVKINPVSKFSSITGKGVSGEVAGKTVMVGNRRFLEESKIEITPLESTAHRSRLSGSTAMLVAVDGKPAAVLAVADPLKDTTGQVIEDLQREGVQIVMLTGDNATTAQSIASKLGISSFEAEVLPQDKSNAVKRLQDQGRIVAMAGDGVNDAPALAQAHVGIAMGTGTDIAMESAGVTLVKGDLTGIIRARRLSRATMRNIRENLFFAFVYNFLGVPIAAGLLYPLTGLLLNPMLAALAMTLSSLSVLGNALRLRRMNF